MKPHLSFSESRRKQHFRFPLILILLASLACSLPSLDLGRRTPAPANPTPTLQAGDTAAPGVVPQGGEPQAEPTALSELPPALVEVDPLPRSELAHNTTPVLYFNQPMDRSSVEAAVKLEPDLPVRFEWLDDATMRLVPGRSLEAGDQLSLTIDTAAKAANGQTLAEPVVVEYRAPGPLRLVERLPAPGAVDVNPTSAVVLTFNRPVVPLGGDPQSLPPAFTLEPAAAGRGEWLNTSTYIFYPQPALLGGAQYTVRVNPGLTSSDGSPLTSGETLEWTFQTAAPVLLSTQPGIEQPVELDDAFVLTFNQPMDRASVEEQFNFVQPEGGPVLGTISWNDAATEMTFRPAELLQRGADYALVLFGAARSLGGAPLGQDFVASLSTVGQFVVTGTHPAAGQTLNADFGYDTVELNFSSPVAPGQDLARLLTIDPPVTNQSIYRGSDGYDIFVSGYFQPSTSYTLEVSPDLRDRWGAALGAPFSIIFSTAPARPSLTIPVRLAGASAVFIPQGETGIAARSVNVERLMLARGSLSLAEFIAAEYDWQGLQNWGARVQATWTRELDPRPNVMEDFEIPLTETGAGLEPGLYFLQVSPQPAVDVPGGQTPALLVSSAIQLTFKTSTRQAFVWAVRAQTGEPVAEETVSFYDRNAQVVASCTTDAQGICQADLPASDEPDRSLYAVIGQPGDANFSLAADDWYQGVAPWEFGVPFLRESAKPDVYLYTDRPIYRPGQAVNFRAVVRARDNGRYTGADLQQITVDVISPYDPATGQSQVLSTLRLPLSSYGTANGVYSLPADARPGTYTLHVQEVEFEDVYFDVAEYRKPEIELDVTFSQPGRQLGQDVAAQVEARYFFGAPAGNLPVRWTLFSAPGYLDLPGGLQTGRLDTSWLAGWDAPFGMQTYITEGQAQTGPDGALTLEIPGALLRERLESQAGRLLELTLEVTVEDESGLPVSARDTLRLHPSPYYVGVRPESWSVSAGEEIIYTLRTVDWQGSPLGDKPLSAHFRKVTWVQQPALDPLAPPDFRMQVTDVGSADLRTSDRGEARLAFTPAEPGTFMLEVTGEEGAITQVLIWVGGAGSAAWPDMPNQRLPLRSDATQFEAGQSARIFIPNPFQGGGGALALVTVERARVMRSQVIPIQGASHELELPLTAADAPNVYVSVVLLGRTGGRPDFRTGYIELQVDPAGQLLQVEVETSPEQAQPGGQVTVNIRARDAAGSPVQGEFSLALVDKAVLALAGPNVPGIVEAFYDSQPLGVQTSYSLAAYAGRSMYTPPGRGGGGGGDIAPPQTLRENFEDTAYWNGSIETDVTGVAQLTLKLPDNLTTWQVDVRGLTGDTRVGEARLDLVTGKPLLIRPVAPRFVVLGDHLELAAVVHNNTQDPLSASVRLEGAGFTLDDPNMAAQPVDLPPGERRRVSWWGTVQDVPALDLVFSVEAGTLRDAARPEAGSLPVLQYAAPQTFGTSGVLAEAEERLELVSLPRSFTPVGGSLTVELAPSLTAAVLDGLEALEEFPRDFTEPVLSRLLPNLAVYGLLRDFQLEDAALRAGLESAITGSVDRLVRVQNDNGGWGWAAGSPSDPYISSYVVFGLTRAAQAGVFVDPQVIEKGREYLVATLFVPEVGTEAWQLDRLAFQYATLQAAGRTDLALEPLYEFRDKLSPWGKAFLALTLETQSPGDQRARTLISDLQAAASRTASGASWQDPGPGWRNWSTPNFTTAVVAYALARLDPASPLLADAVRYLVLHRRPSGAWDSSYETAWVLFALAEAVRGTGDLQASYDFSAGLNESPLMTGQVQSPAQAVNPVTATVPTGELYPEAPNALEIRRGEGAGRLYYRAYLQVGRPVQDAPPLERGLALSRQYYLAGQDCREEACRPVAQADLANPQPLLVRLTLTVPEDMYYVVVEDRIPAGAEVLNPRLRTSQQYISPVEEPAEGETPPSPYDLANPFDAGWGWWFFQDPQVYDDRIRWVVEYLPAGTYELTYRLTPFLAGEFHIIPARAWQYYFPEVEGTSAGQVFTIQ